MLPADINPDDLRELILAKYRHGETARIYTRWNRNSAKFEKMDYD
jgi:replicative DNA helicase